MKRTYSALVFLLFSAAIISAQGNRTLERAKTATIEKRIALVIGNGTYSSAPPLKNPPNDARDMAATLKALGFEVTSGINVDQKAMKKLIREFGLKLKNGGSGLFYYAGHGVQSKGHNYLIPIDADIQSEAEVEDSGVDVSLVLNFMDDAQNGLNIVILDACRNNPFARSFRSATGGLAQVDAPTGTLIAYATAPGNVASDGTEQNGLYTSELLKQMRITGQSATDMFMQVRAEVMKKTESKQVPWEASSLIGAFYFSGKAKNAATGDTPAETKFDTSAFELSYWETIKGSTDPEDFKAYLAKYPNGQFADLAKTRVANLVPVAKPSESRSTTAGGELAFWDSIKNSTSSDEFKAYLNKYPSGEFVDLAKNRLAKLETAVKEKEAADTSAREAAEKAKVSVAGTRWEGASSGKDKSYSVVFSNNGQIVVTLSYYGTYTLEGPYTQDGLTIKGQDTRKKDSMPGMNGAEINLTISADGQTLTGEWHKPKGKPYTVVLKRMSGN